MGVGVKGPTGPDPTSIAFQSLRGQNCVNVPTPKTIVSKNELFCQFNSQVRMMQYEVVGGRGHCLVWPVWRLQSCCFSYL